MAFLNETGLGQVWNKIKAKISLIENAISDIDEVKVDKVSGKGLSTNDYTTAEKEKLAGIATGATKVIVDSELSSTSTNAIQNKVVANMKTNIDDELSNKPSNTGEGASGTWGISISGNANTASRLTGTLEVANGGTGAITAAGALTNLGAVAKAGDTMGGALIANATSVATIGTAQVRNIWAGTADISGVADSLNEGDIYLQYEEV